MWEVLIACLPTILGIVATIVAWNLNPKRKIYDQLDRIYSDIDGLEKASDEALQRNDGDAVAVCLSGLNELRARKSRLRERLK